MLRRLVIVPLLATAALSAVAVPAHAEHVCVYTSGGADDTPKLPGGIVMPYQVCTIVPIDIPPAP
jgi:hypothetical protein